MLEKLLRLLSDRETRSTSELAAALGVNTALVHAMLETLTRWGYLRAVADCSVACSACPAQAACTYPNRPRVWVITEQGEKRLEASA